LGFKTATWAVNGIVGGLTLLLTVGQRLAPEQRTMQERFADRVEEKLRTSIRREGAREKK